MIFHYKFKSVKIQPILVLWILLKWTLVLTQRVNRKIQKRNCPQKPGMFARVYLSALLNPYFEVLYFEAISSKNVMDFELLLLTV